MAEAIQIVGLPQLQQKLTRLQHEVFPQAAARALNRTADTVKSRSSREIARRMGLKARDVRNQVSVRGANQTQLNAEVRFKGRALNLIRFGARQTARGVSAKVGSSRQIVPHAFMVDLGTGQFVGIRKRVGGSSAAERAAAIADVPRVGRIPVVGVVGPSVPDTAAEPELAELRQSVVRERMPIEMRSALDFYVGRLAR